MAVEGRLFPILFLFCPPVRSEHRIRVLSSLAFGSLPQQVLTTFFNLSVLYLHGNSIQRLGEVNKLAVLPRLRSLTLHGNPMEEEKGYRQYVLCTLPHITTFDFSGVTKADRTTAEVWKRMNIKPKKARIKQNIL
ncbi:leucine-rich repeat-containing protein 51-like [Cebus imitator]|uniref:leucine-rich repeat-containing protein 51-like n=1 Tax=Cebus imitator TaxID=2715852 RepID=UPI000809C2F9|nr:leucine-rich repeat-containing protein 51-like [Cebus imitator]